MLRVKNADAIDMIRQHQLYGAIKYSAELILEFDESWLSRHCEHEGLSSNWHPREATVAPGVQLLVHSTDVIPVSYISYWKV